MEQISIRSWNLSSRFIRRYIFLLYLASWSSTKAAFNDVMKSFKFTKNDILKIDYNPRGSDIIFYKKGTNHSYPLDLDPKAE